MSKKITNLIIVFCILLIGLSACSSSGNPTQAASVEAQASAAPTQAAEVTQAPAAATQAETSQEVAYPLVETGQGNCYDAMAPKLLAPPKAKPFYGQDAQFTGNVFSYTDNGDGTVTDNVTGLLWQQTPDQRHYSWTEAHDYCDALGLGSQSDWRMPSLKELFSISDFSEGWPYLDHDLFRSDDNRQYFQR